MIDEIKKVREGLAPGDVDGFDDHIITCFENVTELEKIFASDDILGGINEMEKRLIDNASNGEEYDIVRLKHFRIMGQIQGFA